MIQFLLAFAPITISILSITIIWVLIALATRVRKESKKLKTKVRKMEGYEYWDEREMYK